MPSIFGHALVGFSAARLASPGKTIRRLSLFSLGCSLIPDLDVTTFAFGIQYDSLMGHRGISHSIIFSIVIGIVSSSIYLKSFNVKSIKHLHWAIYFFLVTLSHSILDSMTTGGHGVALFSPFNQHRYLFDYRPIYASPLSMGDFFGLAGIRVLLSEAFVLGMVCLLIHLLAKVSHKIYVLRWVYLLICLGLFGYFMGVVREDLVPSAHIANVDRIEPTLLMGGPHGLSEIPTKDLPGKRLVVNYRELEQSHLLNTVLTPSKIPWAGSFFPTWLGGAGGRWQEPYLQRIWRSFWNDGFYSKSQALERLHSSSSQILRLSPTEKYDLAVGDYYFSSTRAESQLRGRNYLKLNPNTPFWAGYCHAMSMAAISEKEPKREVNAQSVDGHVITFYPNDLKALLGIAYLFPSSPVWDLGNRCRLEQSGTEACIDINPSALVIALANLIGMAKTSFILETEPFNRVNNEPIRKAEIRIVNPPYFTADRNPYYEVDDRAIKFLVDVEIHVTVSRMSAWIGDSEEEDLIYRATLGLDAQMNLVGGRWEDPDHHPDFAWGSYPIDQGPELIGSFTKANRKIEWRVVKALVEQSASSVPQIKPFLISDVSVEPVMHGFSFSSDGGGISGRISTIKYADPIEIYGYIAGKESESVVSAELRVQDKNNRELPLLKIGNFQFLPSPQSGRRLFNLKLPGSLEDREEVRLRFLKKEGSVEFKLPPKKRFDFKKSAKYFQ